MMKLLSITLVTGLACVAPAAPWAGQALLLEGQTIATTNFHGSQPDQTQIFGPVKSVVGPGVELTSFGVSVWVNGQPQPGVFDIDFSDANILITLNADQPFSYFEVLRFEDAHGVIPPYTVTINPATNWAGFSDSDIFISPEFDFFQINLTAMQGLEGQQILLDLAPVTDVCIADIVANGVVDAGDLAFLLAAWSTPPGEPGCSGWGIPEPCPADLNGDEVVDAADLAALLSAWGTCP